MNIICVMVSSVDGKITKGNDPHIYSWTSKEDQEFFSKTKIQFDVLIMGSNTYDAVKPKPETDLLRIVLTRNPEKYKDQQISGQLEFSSESPKTLIDRLQQQGFIAAMLVGGAQINTAFFKSGLVDELWLSIEPKILGKGKMIVAEEDFDINLQIFSFEELNKKGTLLLKYTVLR